MVRYYRKAYEIEQKRKNEMAWLQGMYIYEALCDVSPLMHAFAKKGTKPISYSSEPYAITREDIRHKKQKIEKTKYENIKNKVSAFAIAFNAKMADKKRKEDDLSG